MGDLSMYDYYNSLFEGVIADTPELKNECYKIRYQVYCLEYQGYEDPTAFPDGMERDHFDTHSAHALLRSRTTGEFIGTMRLILNPHGDASAALPVDTLCEKNQLSIPLLFPRQHVAEVSRFCISKKYRRRVTDTIMASAYTLEELEQDKSRIIPSMSLGLISMVVALSQRHDVRQWCAEMEPFLLELLAKLGIYFEPTGPLIDYHGKRQICSKPVDILLARVKRERPDVWDLITKRGEYCSEAASGVPDAILCQPTEHAENATF